MSWTGACKIVRDYIVRIETPDGTGTGFFFTYNQSKSIVAIATALHVISDAHDWRKPIKVRRVEGGEETFLTVENRVVLIDYKRDSAAILIDAKALKAPENMLNLLAVDKYKYPGTRVMWGGYPGIAGGKLCFFQGSVSAFDTEDDSYYIDGVAINGVSGGPVFDEDVEGSPVAVVGIVSSYFINRQRGDPLPGFSMAHDATHLHATIERIKSMDEARKKAEEQHAQAAAAAAKAVDPEPEPKPRKARGRVKGGKAAAGAQRPE